MNLMLCVAKKNQKMYSAVSMLFLMALLVTFITATPSAAQTTQNPETQTGTADWPMAAANPQRTSWTPEEVPGTLRPVWYKPFEPYIPQKVQIIAVNNTLYISTANGLYAVDATTGADKWVYATEMPLGHSPTIYNGVAYVGGLDHKLHAINATTGQGLWTYEAEAGFETNPLVVEGKVYAGNRDGYMYAIYAEGANAGQLAWRYKTGGSILFSAAYQSPNIYFASNDSYGYALNAQTGALVWRSEKLPGEGFYSWWPVIWEDKVIFTGSNAYGTAISWPGSAQMTNLELQEVYEDANIQPGEFIGPVGTVAGQWASGTPTVNVSRIMDYFNEKPWRRTVFVLNQSNGHEDVIAPVLWAGTHSGTRYPPVVGVDGVLYQQSNYKSDETIARGHIAGWVPGVPYIAGVSSDQAAVDEPHAASAGGNLVYWNLCCDRQSGAFNITIPNSTFVDGGLDGTREWYHINYNLASLIPGYNAFFFSPHQNYTKPYASFGGLTGSENGVYGFHGDVNPPIPYNGKLYMHRSNVLIAFADTNGSATQLPLAQIQPAPAATVDPLSYGELSAKLEAEVQKMLDAGHLRPAYVGHGLFDGNAQSACGDDLVDYWHSSAETLYTLSLALPYLSPTMKTAVLSYMQTEYTTYPPYVYNHVGWNSGAAREAFVMPPEITADLVNHPPTQENYSFRNNGGWNGEGVWRRTPFTFYALWKYAQATGNAQAIWSASQEAFWQEFNEQPSDTLLLNMPLIHNAYIAGYIGYLELESLAGQPVSNNVNNELNRLMALRANNFTKDTSYVNMTNPYCRTLNVASNFMFLVPELADYLRTHALNDVTAALDEYNAIAPYWFVSLFAGGYGENAITPIYDSHALFMAQALIMQQPSAELQKYLDVAAFERGDLYYIQKLITVMGGPAPSFELNVSPMGQSIDNGETADFAIEIVPTGGFTGTVTLSTNNPSPDVHIELSTNTIHIGGNADLTLADVNPNAPIAPTAYFVTVTAVSGDIVRTVDVLVLLDALEIYMPVMRN